MERKGFENCNRMGYSTRNQEIRRRGSGRSRKRKTVIRYVIKVGVDMIAER